MEEHDDPTQYSMGDDEILRTPSPVRKLLVRTEASPRTIPFSASFTAKAIDLSRL